MARISYWKLTRKKRGLQNKLRNWINEKAVWGLKKRPQFYSPRTYIDFNLEVKLRRAKPMEHVVR